MISRVRLRQANRHAKKRWRGAPFTGMPIWWLDAEPWQRFRDVARHSYCVDLPDRRYDGPTAQERRAMGEPIWQRLEDWWDEVWLEYAGNPQPVLPILDF